jgi:hypothetical protein
MIGFLVGSKSGNIYRIYHPMKKQFKVSHDVILSETQFFNTRNGKDTETHNLEFENYDGTLTWDESGASDTTSTSDVKDPGGQLHDEIPIDNEASVPIIYDEIVVQPLPAPQRSIQSQESI